MNTRQKAVRDKSYYMDNVKFIRDMVHGYVYLTKFDIELIDTPEFQRLKDVRQLTCQNVYPAARHTRFEHSLGVLELTRQALDSLNRNGILNDASTKGKGIFSEQLVFNAGLAALLHDVGHCPFSHMGEVEFDKDAVFDDLCRLIDDCQELRETSLLNEFEEAKAGSTHEQMSCVVILDKLYGKLSGAGWKNGEDKGSVDFELIIRSILGLQYDMSTAHLHQNNKEKNVIVELIHSPIFDMDKLDYIMRDALSTGIGAPSIDTHRLFNNMYINSKHDYTVLFLHRAVPALQNMVEARDALYMYVYNHHVTVFSDFMYSYIFRRLSHNAEAFQELVKKSIPESEIQAWESAHAKDKINKFDNALSVTMLEPITSLAIVPEFYLFSPEAILEQKRSDGDMICLLHDIYYLLYLYRCFSDENSEEMVTAGLRDVEKTLRQEVRRRLVKLEVSPDKIQTPEDGISSMIANIRRVFTLIDKYRRREFLKPWWKTNIEFTNFIDRNFKGTLAYKKLAEWIGHGDDGVPKGDEFCSQLAKHVIYITGGLYRQYGDRTALLEPLRDGDFFVIERSAHFFDEGTIRKLNIALKRNEILWNYDQQSDETDEFFIDTLTKIFPQRNYYALYEEKGFYIFSKPLQEGMWTPQEREKHYRLIEEIFAFVAKQLIRDGEFAFQEAFETPPKIVIDVNEKESCEKLLTAFAKSKGLVRKDSGSK